MDTTKEFTESDLVSLDMGNDPYRTNIIRLFKESSEMIKKNGRYPVAAICFYQYHEMHHYYVEYGSMVINVDNYGNYIKGYAFHNQCYNGEPAAEGPTVRFVDFSLDGEYKFELSSLLIDMIRNMKWGTFLDRDNYKIDIRRLDETFIPLLNSFLGQIKILNEKMQNESSLP